MKEHVYNQPSDTLDEHSGFDAASLEQLLGKRLRLLALHLKGKHQQVPATSLHNLEFYRRRSCALVSRNQPESQESEIRDVPEPDDLARFPSAVVDGERRQQLGRQLNTSLPPVRIHHHHYARQVVRQLNADAVTIGQEVLVPSPMALQGPQGMALLGHELSHAAQEQQRPRSRAATATEEQLREITAVTHERMLLGSTPSAPPAASTGGPVPVRQDPTNPSPAIRTASQGRNLETSTVVAANTHSTELNATQIQQIQDAVYRDLMLRVREEFERGG